MCATTGYAVSGETFDTLSAYQRSLSYNINWGPLFVLPDWLRAWWQVFGSGDELYLRSVRQGDRVIGVAPLRFRDGVASFIGSVEVCDYLDFIVAQGTERDFFTVLLGDLKDRGIRLLDLRPLRPDSRVVTSLIPLAEERGYEVTSTREELSLELDLPGTWEEYLGLLSRKQRHEVRRKLRRLSEEGTVDYQVFADAENIQRLMPTFFDLFSRSREDKAEFMMPQMESFFRSMADVMSRDGLLRLGTLRVNSRIAAIVMYFDYRDCIYLYNSGYDPEYRQVNVGQISKVWCIRQGITEGKARFDFLRGGEDYKYHLGGREVPLYHCQLTIT